MDDSSQQLAAGVILAVAVVLGGIATWTVVTQWNITSDLQSLLARDSAPARAMAEMERRIGSSTSVFAVVDSPDTEANLEFASDYAERLRKLPAVSLAHFHNEKAFFENHLLLYFDRKTLADMREEFESEIKEAKKKANPLFVSLDSGGKKSSDEDEDLGDELSEKSERFKHAQYDEYLMSSDGYSVTIIVRFQNASKDLVQTNQLLEKVKKVGQRLDPESYHPEMRLQYGGGLVKRKNQYSSIVEDVRISALFTVVGVFLLIALYFRRARAIGFVLIPLVLGAIGALAVGFAIFGQLTTISVFIFAILLGLGIDYGIHLVSSFDERRHGDADKIEAIRGAFGSTGRATAVGATTTLATFVILAFAKSRGLSEFGVVAGVGVAFTLIAMFVLLPAMLMVLDEPSWSEDTSFFLSSGVDDSDSWVARVLEGQGVRIGVVVGAVFTAGSFYAMPRVEFEENIHQVGELKPIWADWFPNGSSDADKNGPSKPVVDARKAAKSRAEDVSERAKQARKNVDPDTFRRERRQDSVGEKYTSAVNKQISSVPTVLLFDSREATRRVYRHLQKKIHKGEFDAIRAVNSIYGFLPGTKTEQKRRLEEIRKLRGIYRNEDLSVLEKDVRKRIERFEPSLDVEAPVDAFDLPGWTKRLYRENGRGAKSPQPGEEFAFGYVIFVTSKVSMNEGDEARHFLRELKSARRVTDTDFRIASPAAVYVSTIEQLRREGVQLMLVALAVILMLLALVFRSVKRGLVAAIPLGFGLIWMVGFGYVVGVRFDMFNVVIIPAIVGIGVDDGVHFYSRYLEYGRGSLDQTFRTVGSTIVMTSLTSMVGFGGLALADYHGVRSIGHLAVVGILTTLLATLILLPVLLACAERFDWSSITPEE